MDITAEETDNQTAEAEFSGKISETNYTVTANSALSEYLAVNMLAGADIIDLKEFPESADQDYLFDAWLEAVYQNTLILGASSAMISGDGRFLMVEYDDLDTMKGKQEEIIKEVDKVVNEIITAGMSEIEKELAINQYLCDTAEYDMAALENAEENGFVTIDEKFNDSFTPYGILINKVGVCASYSAAFKLLADAAGLECVVVTGYLEGTLPHAWNKVKIDGEWQIIDTTNNDNELIFNALFNLPDRDAQKVLVEDENYVLDSTISNYSANSEDKEFYRINNRFFEMDAIATPLAKELKEYGITIMRTDYKLDEEQFLEIAQEVALINDNYDLSGYYWMGVIILANN